MFRKAVHFKAAYLLNLFNEPFFSLPIYLWTNLMIMVNRVIFILAFVTKLPIVIQHAHDFCQFVSKMPGIQHVNVFSIRSINDLLPFGTKPFLESKLTVGTVGHTQKLNYSGQISSQQHICVVGLSHHWFKKWLVLILSKPYFQAMLTFDKTYKVTSKQPRS